LNSAIPSTTAYQYPPTSQQSLPPPRQRPRRPWRRLLHPLTAICAAQAALSLTLVWSNTAFADEAEYLSAGQLEWAHWLHGAPVPSYLTRFSGSPVIYPPLGALANSAGGLAGARILSLMFMLGATVLLYLTASRLIGPRGAGVAAALWALSEPALRLAFATYDPLSVLLTALSAWLVVQAGYRGRRGAFVTAAAAAIALANATAYSGIVIDPVVIVFAFLTWLPSMRARRASLCTAWLAGALAAFFGLVMAASRSSAGLSTVFNRSGSDHQNILLVLNDSWRYSGLIAVLAVIGAVTAFGAESRSSAVLLALLGCTALVVPAAQIYEQTAWSLDKHLAYGIWFAAIAAGYGCNRLIRWLPGARRQLAALCCTIALVYPALNSWVSAWQVYHAWPDARSFITAFRPVAAKSSGLIDVSEIGPQNIVQYYTPQGREWARWSHALSLDPSAVRPSTIESYYTRQLSRGNYGVIALFYATTFSSAPELPGALLLSPAGSTMSERLLGLVGDNSGEPGLAGLTLALEQDREYRLAGIGSYESADGYSSYAIWQKKPQK
jgi:Dolichyl-phosphate-mannose-protein mannosyltransferase